MRVHVGDLIAHPNEYRIDLQEGRVCMSAKGESLFYLPEKMGDTLSLLINSPLF